MLIVMRTILLLLVCLSFCLAAEEEISLSDGRSFTGEVSKDEKSIVVKGKVGAAMIRIPDGVAIASRKPVAVVASPVTDKKTASPLERAEMRVAALEKAVEKAEAEYQAASRKGYDDRSRTVSYDAKSAKAAQDAAQSRQVGLNSLERIASDKRDELRSAQEDLEKLQKESKGAESARQREAMAATLSEIKGAGITSAGETLTGLDMYKKAKAAMDRADKLRKEQVTASNEADKLCEDYSRAVIFSLNLNLIDIKSSPLDGETPVETRQRLSRILDYNALMGELTNSRAEAPRGVTYTWLHSQAYAVASIHQQAKGQVIPEPLSWNKVSRSP